MTPPWSRRRATQPANLTFCPASVVRNEPAACVRSTKTPCERPDETIAKCRGGVTAGSLRTWAPALHSSVPEQSVHRRRTAASAGHRVTLCGHTPATRSRSALIHAPIVVPGPVLTDPGDIDGPVDLVLLAVKDTHNEQAAGWLRRLCDDHTVICVLQNGVEQVERVGRFSPSAHVVPAACGSRRSRSRRAGSGCAPTCAWCCPRRGRRNPGGTVASAGMTVELDPDFRTEAWRKLMVNALAGSWCWPVGGPACSGAPTSPRWRAAISRNAWPWPVPKAPRSPTPSSTR